MALIFNKIMSKEYDLHVKIIEAYRSKNFKKSTKDSRKHLYFRIKPDKSPSELIVPYNDLKDHFPYALIDFYEQRIKEEGANYENEQTIDMQDQGNKKAAIRKIIEVKQSKTTKKSQKNDQPQQKLSTTKITLQQQPNNDSSPTTSQLIYDMDKYLQEKYLQGKERKVFHVLFSESQSIENRYLKDLSKEDAGLGKKAGKEEVRDVKRKKVRVDYGEEE